MATVVPQWSVSYYEAALMVFSSFAGFRGGVLAGVFITLVTTGCGDTAPGTSGSGGGRGDDPNKTGGSSGGSTAGGGTSSGAASAGGSGATGGATSSSGGTSASSSGGSDGEQATCDDGCTPPPAPVCANSVTLEEFSNGSCESDGCVFDSTLVPCETGCANAACCDQDHHAADGSCVPRLRPSQAPTCRDVCVTAQDCAQLGATVDADNWACSYGTCEYLGCNAGECATDYGSGYACAATGDLPLCQKTCSTADDCTDGTALGDLDNVVCDGGVCRNHGCVSDDECVTTLGSEYVCAQAAGVAAPGCYRSCDTVADCGDTAEQQAGFTCELSICLSLGCGGTDECGGGVCHQCPDGETCDCPEGTAWATSQCEDIDECALDWIDCPANSTCTNLSGSADCVCDVGYQDDGAGGCEDVDECVSVDCGNGECENLVPGYKCNCEPGYSDVDGACVLTDACEAGEKPGYGWCDGACANFSTSELHCGSCNSPCPWDALCDGGSCRCLAGGYGLCDGECVDLESSEQTCGSCDVTCPTSATCVEGICDCPGDESVCGQECVDLGEDRNNCGACGHGCECGESCSGGDCVAAPEYQLCSSMCVDTSGDEQHCGSCDIACLAGRPCTSGECEYSVDVALGYDFTCALQNTGEVTCWGYNLDYRLGKSGTWTGPNAPLAGISAIDVEAGSDHACALTAGGAVYCWGVNWDNQFSAELPEGIYESPTLVPGVSNVVDLALGMNHSCYLEEGGDLYCVGHNASGQIGGGYANGEEQEFPVQVSPIGAVSSVSAGDAHTCAIASGALYCWGSNGHGQLGAPDTVITMGTPRLVSELNDVQQVAAGDKHTCARVLSGDLYCWGNNAYGQVGNGNTTDQYGPTKVLSKVTGVFAGGSVTCATRDALSPLCWGDGSTGQLGQGNLESVTSPGVTPGSIDTASFYALAPTGSVSGESHACLLDDLGNLYCYGDRDRGQVGDGVVSEDPLSTPYLVSWQ